MKVQTLRHVVSEQMILRAEIVDAALQQGGLIPLPVSQNVRRNADVAGLPAKHLGRLIERLSPLQGPDHVAVAGLRRGLGAAGEDYRVRIEPLDGLLAFRKVEAAVDEPLGPEVELAN